MLGGGSLWLRDEPEFGKNFLVRRTIAGAVEGHHERYPRHLRDVWAGRLPNGECDYVKGANIAGLSKWLMPCWRSGCVFYRQRCKLAATGITR